MANTTHTEVPGGAKSSGGFPAFRSETYPSQILWLVLAFGALYLVMSRVALPRMAAILDARHDRISSDLAAAAKLKADSDAALAAYEQALATAKAKAQAIASETRDRLQADADAKRKTVEAGLAAKLDAAEKTISADRTKAMTNVRGIAADAATAIVERLAGAAPSSAQVDAALSAVSK